MIGILLITHEPLGAAFISAVTHVLGRAPTYCLALDIKADENTNAVIARAANAVRRLDQGAGVLVLTDLLGATPCNCASALKQALGETTAQVAVLSGVSLSMLLRAINYRHLSLQEVTLKAREGGNAGITQLS